MITSLMLTFLIVIVISYVVLIRIINKKKKSNLGDFFNEHNFNWKPDNRVAIINSLKNTNFDILIIGGGASGVGCAIDAATRGLKTALIEANDFGSGTSSKSTKLLHGGIRYLEKAVNDIDKHQFKLVREALREREILINSCPFLARRVKIIFPIYKRLLIPYYYIGLKLYDWMSGSRSLGRSSFVNLQETVALFPHIRKTNLRGSVAYYDGQFYDAKMNVTLAISAAYYGATVSNYIKLVKINKSGEKIVGITCHDTIHNEVFDVKCKVLINTTGPFTDEIRKMSNENCETVTQQSYGTHIVVPAIFSPKNMGFVDPRTDDSRIAFFMNFKGKTLIGSTDVKCKPEMFINPSDEDLSFLIHEANFYTDDALRLTKNDVLSAWTGIRPLVKDTTRQESEKIVRKHMCKIEDSNMVTLSGGKWTLYRLMAEEALNKIVKHFGLACKRKCVTEFFVAVGSQGYTKATEQDIAIKLCIPDDIAKHLATSYGTKSYKMKEYFENTYTRLIDNYPYTKEEVIYCLEHEMAYKISDILFNRFLISYVDVRKAFDLVNVVGSILQDYYSWSKDQLEIETQDCVKLLDTCGYSLLK